MAPHHTKKRAAFVTIGQTPRADLVPEMVSWIGDAIDVVEYGALDGMSRQAIGEIGPTTGDRHLVTRLGDGSEVVVAMGWMRERLQELLTRLADEDFLVVVLLCTGHFGGLQASGLFLEAQAIVDHATAAFAESARSIGVMVPLFEQMAEFHFQPRHDQTLRLSHASPYTEGRMVQAAQELADADLIVMHCIGYTEAMRRTVADTSGRPTLLARRLVATAVAQLV
jgi:protein AroM